MEQNNVCDHYASVRHVGQQCVSTHAKEIGVMYKTQNHSWVSYGNHKRYMCMRHGIRIDRCHKCSLLFCPVHLQERKACLQCTYKKSDIRMLKPCAKHRAFPNPVPIFAKLAKPTASSQYDAVVQQCSSLYFLRSTLQQNFKSRCVSGATIVVGNCETRKISERKSLGCYLILHLSRPLVRAYASTTNVYSVQVHGGHCYDCFQLRRPLQTKPVSCSASKRCTTHSNMIRSCKVCRGRFTVCKLHKTLSAACHNCS